MESPKVQKVSHWPSKNKKTTLLATSHGNLKAPPLGANFQGNSVSLIKGLWPAPSLNQSLRENGGKGPLGWGAPKNHQPPIYTLYILISHGYSLGPNPLKTARGVKQRPGPRPIPTGFPTSFSCQETKGVARPRAFSLNFTSLDVEQKNGGQKFFPANVSWGGGMGGYLRFPWIIPRLWILSSSSRYQIISKTHQHIQHSIIFSTTSCCEGSEEPLICPCCLEGSRGLRYMK